MQILIYVIVCTIVFPYISELLEKCREIRNEIIQEEEQYQINDDITTDSGKGRNKEPFISCNEFIRWFHQFLIPNLQILLQIFDMISFSIGKLKKLLLDQYDFFFSCSNSEQFVEKIRETNW